MDSFCSKPFSPVFSRSGTIDSDWSFGFSVRSYDLKSLVLSPPTYFYCKFYKIFEFGEYSNIICHLVNSGNSLSRFLFIILVTALLLLLRMCEIFKLAEDAEISCQCVSVLHSKFLFGRQWYFKFFYLFITGCP